MRSALILAALLLPVSPGWAATYYVATDGNNANDGSSESPWRYPQKCAGSPVAAGDTCIVRSGTYSTTGSGSSSFVIEIASGRGSASGTSTAAITIKSEVLNGAKLVQPSISGSGARAISVGLPYYVIEGFDIDGAGVSYGTAIGTSHTGVAVYANNVTVRKNKIHDIARTQCSNSQNASSGVFAARGVSNVTIEYNRIYTIGRLRNGDSGCSTTVYQLDHGIYANYGSNLTVRRNVIYDVNRGYPLQIVTSDGTTRDVINAKVYNNTFGGEAPQTSSPHGQIVIGERWINGEIKNNVFLDTSPAGVIQVVAGWSGFGHSGNVVSHNRTNVNTTGSDPIFVPALASGWTSTNNSRNVSLGLTNASCTGTGGSCTATDFTLASGSAMIDAGTPISGSPHNGSAPDIGAYETIPTPTVASAQSVYVDVTLPMSMHTPVRIPSASGWSVSCTPSCGTLSVATVSILAGSSAVVRVEVTGWVDGACKGTQTITVSYSATTGTTTDSAEIGQTYQKLHTFGPVTATNNCSGVGPPPPTGTPYLLYEFEDNANDTSGNFRHGTPLNATYTVGKVGLALQGVDNTAVSVTALFGSGINPTATSFTIAFWYEVPQGSDELLRTIAGTSSGTNQRLYIAQRNGTFQVAAQSQSIGVSDTSNLSSAAGWHRLCLRVNSSTDTITLYSDGVEGAGGATKTVTSYILPSDWNFGLPTGFNPVANAGGGKWDHAIIWNSLVSCTQDWDDVKPTGPPIAGTLTQAAYKLQLVYLDTEYDPIDYRPTNMPGDVPSPGAVAQIIQVNCEQGDCGQQAFRLMMSTDCAVFNQLVPNIPTVSGVSFWGSSADPHLNRCTAWSALSGNLSHTAGPTMLTADAIPSLSMGAGSSVTLRYIVKFESGLDGQSRCFKLVRQDGTPLSSSIPYEGVRVNLVKPRASTLFR